VAEYLFDPCSERSWLCYRCQQSFSNRACLRLLRRLCRLKNWARAHAVYDCGLRLNPPTENLNPREPVSWNSRPPPRQVQERATQSADQSAGGPAGRRRIHVGAWRHRNYWRAGRNQREREDSNNRVGITVLVGKQGRKITLGRLNLGSVYGKNGGSVGTRTR